MAIKIGKATSYALESTGRKIADKELKKLGVDQGIWDKSEGKNGRRRAGSTLRQN
jgi:hypothetical protein